MNRVIYLHYGAMVAGFAVGTFSGHPIASALVQLAFQLGLLIGTVVVYLHLERSLPKARVVGK